MKRQAYTIIALLVLVGSMAVAAQAQNRRIELVADIPFQFNIGDKTMPAGKYTISQVNPASDHSVMQVRSDDGSSSALLQMNDVTGQANGTARLVFHCYGNRRYFAQVWTVSDASGLEAPKSRAERATQKEMAGLNVRTKTETIALRSR